MADTEEKKPEREEIMNQLNRLLAAKRFTRATNYADFLRLVVTLTLAGKEPTQEVIGKALFPKFQKKKSSDVRVTAKGLRAALRKYYAYEGREDPIVIALPEPQTELKTAYLPGEQYRPFFRYAPLTEAVTMFRLGQYYLARNTSIGNSYAISHFMEAIERDGNHLDAHLFLAETLCLQTWMGHSDCKDAFCIARAIAERATVLSPRSWRARAILGATFFFLRNRADARLAFKEALSIDRIGTERYPWYHLYLLASGETKKALTLARVLADVSTHSAYALACHAFLLYAARLPDDSWTQARKAIDIDDGCWPAYLVLALIELAAGAKSEAFSYFELAAPSQDRKQCEFPGIKALCHQPNEDPDVEENFMLDIWFHIKGRRSSPTQTAFALMAEGKNKKALEAINLACSRCDPVIQFAELLPIFDPLRKYSQFKALLRHRIKAKSTPCPEAIPIPWLPKYMLYYASSSIPKQPTSLSDES